jgi:hypothetical protein
LLIQFEKRLLIWKEGEEMNIKRTTSFGNVMILGFGVYKPEALGLIQDWEREYFVKHNLLDF